MLLNNTDIFWSFISNKINYLKDLKSSIEYTNNEEINTENIEQKQCLYYVTLKQLIPLLDRVGRSITGINYIFNYTN